MELIITDQSTGLTEIDKKQIVELSIRNNFFINEIFFHIYEKIYPPFAKKYDAKQLDTAKQQLAKIFGDNLYGTITAKLDNEVIGFLVYIIDDKTENIELAFLLVKQEYRDRGIATNMIDFLKETRELISESKLERAESPDATPLDKCKSLLPVSITVNCDKQLIKFYEKQGFKEMTEGKQYTKLVYPESIMPTFLSMLSMLSTIHTKNDLSLS